MGTPELARTVLVALASDQRFTVLAVVAQPDRPKGRDLALQPPPVKLEALNRGLPLLQPTKARDPAFLEQLRSLSPELIVVAAYGQLLPQALLDIPRHGCLNVHTSLLPRYRGAAPIQWAIANGDRETGVTIMRMDAGLDTGPILTTAITPITDLDTGQSLHDRLAVLGADLLRETIAPWVQGRIEARPQPTEGVSNARKITKEDGRVDWSQPARVIWNRLRAFTPWPGTYCFLPAEPKPQFLKLHTARPVEGSGQPGSVMGADSHGVVVTCGEGALCVTELQLEGGRRMTAREFLAGHTVTRLQ
jgi:methionyl-tRNA formyltransferase